VTVQSSPGIPLLDILDYFAKNLKGTAHRETQLAMGKELILELKFYRRRGTGTSVIRSHDFPCRGTHTRDAINTRAFNNDQRTLAVLYIAARL